MNKSLKTAGIPALVGVICLLIYSQAYNSPSQQRPKPALLFPQVILVQSKPDARTPAGAQVLGSSDVQSAPAVESSTETFSDNPYAAENLTRPAEIVLVAQSADPERALRDYREKKFNLYSENSALSRLESETKHGNLLSSRSASASTSQPAASTSQADPYRLLDEQANAAAQEISTENFDAARAERLALYQSRVLQLK